MISQWFLTPTHFSRLKACAVHAILGVVVDAQRELIGSVVIN